MSLSLSLIKFTSTSLLESSLLLTYFIIIIIFFMSESMGTNTRERKHPPMGSNHTAILFLQSSILRILDARRCGVFFKPPEMEVDCCVKSGFLCIAFNSYKYKTEQPNYFTLLIYLLCVCAFYLYQTTQQATTPKENWLVKITATFHGSLLISFLSSPIKLIKSESLPV